MAITKLVVDRLETLLMQLVCYEKRNTGETLPRRETAFVGYLFHNSLPENCSLLVQ